jgi:glycosyltransferase involved in cell wall biosynthesis
MSRPLRILHAHATFGVGGKEVRATRLMNAFGDMAEHTVLVANPRKQEARDMIDPAIKAVFPDRKPKLRGVVTPTRLLGLSRYMRRFDLVLTYNRGAFDAVMARRLFGGCPLIHHEDGFNADEAAMLKAHRNLYRQMGLPAAYRLVVPSRKLEAIARASWGQPRDRIARIANGVMLERTREGQKPIPGLEKRPGELIVCSVGGLRAVKNQPRLVRALAAMQMPNARLVILGEGPERERILAEAEACGVADRVHLPGVVTRPADYLGGCDIFAMSSDSEQQPIALLEAMSAGLPVVSTAVGDIGQMVSPANWPLMVPVTDEAAFAAALDRLAGDESLRRTLGAANRAKVAADHDEDVMISRYARLYGEAAGRPEALLSQAADLVALNDAVASRQAS